MKVVSITTECRAYSEEEANNYIQQFRQEAAIKGYVVKSAGWTHRTKTKNKEIVAEAWITKCTAVYADIWDEDEGGKNINE